MLFVTVLELLGMLKPLFVMYPFTACDFTIEFIEKPSSAAHRNKIFQCFSFHKFCYTIVNVSTFKLFRS